MRIPTRLGGSVPVLLLVIASAACASTRGDDAATGATSALDAPGALIARASAITPHGRLHVSPALGFEDSSLDGDKKAFCFSGNVDAVCDAIQRAADAIDADTSNGAHGTIDVQSCTVAADAVSLRYHLSDDNGGHQTVARTVSRCAGDGPGDAASFIVASSAHRDSHGDVVVQAGFGFADRASDRDMKSFCYVGSADSACAAIADYAKRLGGDSATGATDTMTLDECAVTDGQITASYHLSAAHGAGEDVVQLIDPCDGSSTR